MSDLREESASIWIPTSTPHTHSKCNARFISTPASLSALPAPTTSKASRSFEDHGRQKKTEGFSCLHCSKLFTQKRNCSRHEKECTNNPEKLVKLFICEKCASSFSRKDNLNTHLKHCKVENLESPSNVKKKRTPCLVQDCHSEFFRKSSLIDHLTANHSDVVNLKTPLLQVFTSYEDFLSWKEKEEEATFSYFSQKSGKRDHSVAYFYCQHDGSGKPHSVKKTNRKNRKGQVKVGHYCIANMKVTSDSDGKVHLKYFPTHSHVCRPEDFTHHPLPSNTNSFITQQIADEVSPSKIFKKMQSTYTPTNTENVINFKANILTKKIIRERARKERIAQKLHVDDAKAVFLMVKDMVETNNSVLIYKPLGNPVIHGPDAINDLPNSEDLFLLGIQTDRQLELLKLHAGKILIIDETHGTNQYKYQLLTVLIADNNRHGWPVAHLITSRSDAATLKFFFAEIKSRLKESRVNCVITDDDPALINAVNDGFQENVRHILCKWHVLKALRDNLRTKVSKEIFQDMFDEVKLLVNCKNETSFKKLCTAFFNKYENAGEASKFLAYFKQYYMEKTEKWAMCYRNYSHGEINTTGHAESFHNKLKTVYLKRKVNKRLDDLITILVDLEWEDFCTRSREAVTGPTNLPQHIADRHHRSLSIPDEAIIEVCENMWEVTSVQTQNTTYVIEKLRFTCSVDLCFCKCSNSSCHGLCSHLYYCNCPDNHPLCKHVHKIQTLLTRNQPNSTIEHSEFYILPTNEHTDSEELQVTNSTSENNRPNFGTKYCNMVERLQSNLLFLDNLQKAAEKKQVPEHVLAHVDSLVDNIVARVKNLTKEDLNENLTHMKPVEKFHSQQKLKTQLSQLLPFKRPLGKRKNKASPSELAEKKRKVVKNLLQYLPEDDETSN